MRLITMPSMTTKLIALLFVAAITTVVVWSSSFTPAEATHRGSCGGKWCDWYEVCRWELWAWDSQAGWEKIHTDGYC